MRRLYLRDDLARAWQGRDAFELAARMPGEIFRDKDRRRTLRFRTDERSYFLKYHAGVGWGEIFKSLFQGKRPVLGAAQEKQAIEQVAAADIDTLTIAGFGERGRNPAARESFLVTDDLVDTVSLEDVCECWPATPPSPDFRRRLVERLARIARRMHDAGVNHRDFYLCHFLVDSRAMEREDISGPVYLIDLHRSQVRTQVPRRWRIKDLAGLYFSTARSGISRRDLVYFIRAYSGRAASVETRLNPGFWKAVRHDAERIYRRYYGKKPEFPLQFSEHPGYAI